MATIREREVERPGEEENRMRIMGLTRREWGDGEGRGEGREGRGPRKREVKGPQQWLLEMHGEVVEESFLSESGDAR